MRAELFGMIHKALRSRLFDLSIELARCDFTDAAQARTARNAYERTVGFLREHHEHEESFVEPFLEKRAPSIVSANRAQHEAIDAKLARLDALIAEAKGAESAKRLVSAYDEFLAEYLVHMRHEEGTVQAALWEHFTDEEILGVQGRIQGSIPPPRFAEWLEIMLPALNLDERAMMLGGIRRKAPEPAFRMASEIAVRVLGQNAFAAVSRRIGEA